MFKLNLIKLIEMLLYIRIYFFNLYEKGPDASLDVLFGLVYQIFLWIYFDNLFICHLYSINNINYFL